jgi:hypothetical protein
VENPEQRGEVQILRYGRSLECDVVVTVRGREIIMQLPDYTQAVKWAQMEAKTCKILATLSEEPPG